MLLLSDDAPMEAVVREALAEPGAGRSAELEVLARGHFLDERLAVVWLGVV